MIIRGVQGLVGPRSLELCQPEGKVLETPPLGPRKRPDAEVGARPQAFDPFRAVILLVRFGRTVPILTTQDWAHGHDQPEEAPISIPWCSGVLHAP